MTGDFFVCFRVAHPMTSLLHPVFELVSMTAEKEMKMYKKDGHEVEVSINPTEQLSSEHSATRRKVPPVHRCKL